MKSPRRALPILGLSALLALAAACTRDSVTFGSPEGPSTTSLVFTLEAHPNVILATAERPAAVIKAVVRRNGQPVRSLAVYFTVLSGPGEFDDYNRRYLAVTDSTGAAYATYLGPVADELAADTTATIKAQPETASPDYVTKTVEVRILKGSN